MCVVLGVSGRALPLLMQRVEWLKPGRSIGSVPLGSLEDEHSNLHVGHTQCARRISAVAPSVASHRRHSRDDLRRQRRMHQPRQQHQHLHETDNEEVEVKEEEGCSDEDGEAEEDLDTKVKRGRQREQHAHAPGTISERGVEVDADAEAS